jgi:hypothetical protein
MRAPLIAGIIKIRSLGEELFADIHTRHASPATWRSARLLLSSCPSQRALSEDRYEHWKERSQKRNPSSRRRTHSVSEKNRATCSIGDQDDDGGDFETIKAFLLQRGVAVPARKLTVAFMLDQLRSLKVCAAAAAQPSSSTPIKIRLPRRKAQLVAHFTDVILALSPSTA